MTKADILARLESVMAFDGGQKFRLPDGFLREINGLRDDIEADIESEAKTGPFVMGGPSGVSKVDLAGMADRLGPAVKSAVAAKKKGLFGFVLTPALIMMIVQVVIQLIAALMKRDAAFALPLYQARPDEIDPVVMTAVYENA